jgi:hypothetical protein
MVVSAVLVSGCGSSTTTTTTTTTAQASVATTASTSTSPPAATQSTGSTGAQTTTKTTTTPKTTTGPKKVVGENKNLAAEVKRAKERKALQKTAPQKSSEAAKPRPGFANEVPKAQRFPPEIAHPYEVQCEAGGSPADCECILVKLELTTHQEKSKSMAELISVLLALKQGASLAKVMNHGTDLPPNAQRAAGECKNI